MIVCITLLGLGCARESRLTGKLVLSDDNSILMYDFSERKPRVKRLFSASDNGMVSEPTISSDGGYLCFVYDDWSSFSLVALRVGHQDIDTLIQGSRGRLDFPAFSPDNTKIAFLILRGSKLIKPTGRFSLGELVIVASCAVLDVGSREYRVITEPCLSGCTPSWSRDGKSLCVSTYDGRIVRIDLNGTEIESFGHGYCPALSPDGRYLAYLVDRSLYVADLEKKTERRVTSKFSYYAPEYHCAADMTWSPDSKYLLYEAQAPLYRILGWSSGYVIVPAHRRGLTRALRSAAYLGACWIPRKPG
jgi:WD40 repeat protein